MPDRFKKDNIFFGILIGAISIVADYLLLAGFDYMVDKITGYGHVLNSRKISLIILAFNMILFRFMIVNWGRIQTGKGLFISIVAATILYIFFHKTYFPSL